MPDNLTALLAGNDLAFLEVMEFIKESNLHVPQDFSLIVFDKSHLRIFLH